MNHLFAVALFFLAMPGRANVAHESWPKRVQDFPQPGTHLVGDFRITVKEAADQAGGGSGGAVYDIIVHHVRTGADYTINAQCVGVRVLALYDSWPQLEIWGRGGGGSWSRSLYRRIKGAYNDVRTDEFTEDEFAATDKARTATMPKVETVLYFVETRLPADP